MGANEATTALDVVARAEKSAAWRPTPGAVGAVSVTYGAAVGATAWGVHSWPHFWVALALTALTALTALQLRSLLFRPTVQPRGDSARRVHWLADTWFLWFLVFAVLPVSLGGFGILAGLAAAAHAFLAVRTGRVSPPWPQN